MSLRELPEAEVAFVVHHGDYSSIGRAYQALMVWIEQNGYRITGTDREVYLQGPGQSQDTKSYVTEVQFLVAKP